MPTDILIYMIVAAVMVFWLRSVLGTRHGEERERPNPFDEKNMPKEEEGQPLPPIEMTPAKEPTFNEGSASVDAGLVQIALADKNFDAKEFKENAADAFEIIVTAFADGDRETLKDLCTKDVYNAFDSALKDREKAGETVSTEIHAVRKTDIVAAGIEGRKHAFVTIRFTADETYVIEDKDGTIIAGHPDRVTEMTDKWTFTRDVKSSDPRWFLSKTEDDVIEDDGKTPLPDAG
jgi:predicted lipid-binding transport protein (Tim44 family)